MLDWTDRHCRYFLRLMSKHALLYTEMVTTGAILHGDQDRLLGFDPLEGPIVMQLGGSDPDDLGLCASIVANRGYDQINLNVGCPSDRVQKGRFGACLMAEPQLVADCVASMKSRVGIPVTVKTRIGIDDRDSYEALAHFVSTVAEGGCDTFIIHARKAWLSGLSPKQNREVPPLRYDIAARIKQDFPHLTVVLNGGIETIQQAVEHLEHFSGVMLGRAAYHNPYLLAEVDQTLYGDLHPIPTREEVFSAMIPYIEKAMKPGMSLHGFTRHMLGLFYGHPGGRLFRRSLGELATRKEASPNDLWDILRDRHSPSVIV